MFEVVSQRWEAESAEGLASAASELERGCPLSSYPAEVYGLCSGNRRHRFIAFLCTFYTSLFILEGNLIGVIIVCSLQRGRGPSCDVEGLITEVGAKTKVGAQPVAPPHFNQWCRRL